MSAVEDLTQEELHAVAERIKKSVATYRKLRGDETPADPDPQHPSEGEGVQPASE
jgi:hypothetical protein